VLVIDQGGYPFGAEGKRQLADTLIDIAKNNPELAFDIKPRYAAQERGRIIHAISDHLADYLDDMPGNMRFIETPGILEDIIKDYDAMVSTWSTAYLAALAFNIPMILIEGFDSVDVFDVRKQRIAAAYNHLRKTGCLFHYKALAGQKLDFRYASGSYRESEIYRPEREASPAIVSYLEYLKKNFVLTGLRHIASSSPTVGADSLHNEDVVYKSIHDDDYPLLRTYKYELNSFMQEAVFQNRCMGGALDFSGLERLYRAPETYPSDDIEVYAEILKAEFQSKLDNILNAYFRSAEGMAAAGSDKIIQDYYFDWLFASGQYDMLMKPGLRLLAPESRDYNMARYWLLKKRYLKAYRFLGSFIDLVKASDYEMQLAKSKRLSRTLKPFISGFHAYLFGAYLIFTKRYSVFESINELAVNRSGVLTLFRMKDMNSRGMYGLSRGAYLQHAEYLKQQTGRRANRTLKKRLKSLENIPVKILLRIEHKRTLNLIKRTSS
jgi:hypothetical protein